MSAVSTGDARFFARSGPHHLSAVAEAAQGIAPNIDLILDGVAPLQTAGPSDVSFLDNRRYASALEQTLAGAVIVHPSMRDRVPETTATIVTTEPYAGWARVAALFHPAPVVTPGIHRVSRHRQERRHRLVRRNRTAVRDRGRSRKSARAAGSAAGAVIGSGVVIGADCRIGAHASLSHALAGRARLRLSRCPDRTGGLRLRRDEDRLCDCAAARAGDPGGRRRGWRQYHDRPWLDAGHGDRRRVASR